MEYIVEISFMNGDGVADEQLSRFISPTPLPVANVGDFINVRSGGGPDFKQAQQLKVIRREFNYTPAIGNLEPAIHVQLFCENVPAT